MHINKITICDSSSKVVSSFSFVTVNCIYGNIYIEYTHIKLSMNMCVCGI